MGPAHSCHDPWASSVLGAAFQQPRDKLQMSLFPPKSKGSVPEPRCLLPLQECGKAAAPREGRNVPQGRKTNPTRQKFYFCTPGISPVLADTGICWCLWFSCYKQAVAMGTLLLVKAQMYCQGENSSDISCAGQQLCSMCWNAGGILLRVRGWEQGQQGFPSSRL